MSSLLFVILAAAAAVLTRASLACPPAWSSVGPTLFYSNVSGVDLDFSGASQGASPVVAVAFLDSATGATRIQVEALTAGHWMTVASHEPELSQDYDTIILRYRGGIAYVGMGIEGDNLASVLRGKADSIGMEGSWAFPASGQSWGFDIDAAPGGAGDMRLLGWANITSLSVVGYNHTGWDSYPASDAFGPPMAAYTGLALAPAVTVVAGPYPQLAGLALFNWGGAPSVFVFSVRNTTDLVMLPSVPFVFGPQAVATLSWPHAQQLCVAVADTTGNATCSVSLWCMDGPSAAGKWTEAGVAASWPGRSSVVSLSLSITVSGVATVVVIPAEGESPAIISACALAASGACSAGWAASYLGAPGSIAYAVTRTVSESSAVSSTLLLVSAASGSLQGQQQQMLMLCNFTGS